MRRIVTLTLLLFSSFATLLAQNIGDTQVGVASFYSDEFDGDRTAYGEIYRKGELVAAHSLYPHNSMVRVTNNANGNTTTVRIIDQGPWIEGRIIEVSRRAAEILGFAASGTTRVTLTLLSTPDQPAPNPSTTQENPTKRAANETPAVPAPTPYQSRQEPRRSDQKTAEEAAQQAKVESQSAPPKVERAAIPAQQREVVVKRESKEVDPPVTYSPDQSNLPLSTSGNFEDGIYKVEIRDVGTGDYGVQVAALGDLQSAMQYVATLQSKWFTNILMRKSGALYKVILGPFPTQKEASIYAKDLKRKYKIAGFTVELNK